MKKGDRVTGVPNPIIRKVFPTVTGTYDSMVVKRPGGEFTVEFVVVDNGKQEIDCINVRPAHRRDKNTGRVDV